MLDADGCWVDVVDVVVVFGPLRRPTAERWFCEEWNLLRGSGRSLWIGGLWLG